MHIGYSIRVFQLFLEELDWKDPVMLQEQILMYTLMWLPSIFHWLFLLPIISISHAYLFAYCF